MGEETVHVSCAMTLVVQGLVGLKKEPHIPLTHSGKALQKRQFYRCVSIFQMRKGKS